MSYDPMEMYIKREKKKFIPNQYVHEKRRYKAVFLYSVARGIIK